MSEEKQQEEASKKNDKIDVRDITEEAARKDAKLKYTKRLHVTFTTDEGEKLEGDFEIKRANINDQGRIGTIMAGLRDDKPISALDWRTTELHEAMAVCQVCVTQAPPWFTMEMYESDVVLRVSEEALAFQKSFRKSLVK